MENRHIISSFAWPFLLGAYLQIDRYKEVQSHFLENPPHYSRLCMHEVSNLFEDLSTVTNYMRKIGIDHSRHQLWVDVRNHIRHDVREEFNKESLQKQQRSERLKINEKLQMYIVYQPDTIKIGETTVLLDEIIQYLDWAKESLGVIEDEAIRTNLIRHV